jgi:hypothetical protein
VAYMAAPSTLPLPAAWGARQAEPADAGRAQAAHRYLKTHALAPALQQALNQCLKDRPEDPNAFLVSVPPPPAPPPPYQYTTSNPLLAPPPSMCEDHAFDLQQFDARFSAPAHDKQSVAEAGPVYTGRELTVGREGEADTQLICEPATCWLRQRTRAVDRLHAR